jgi:hypothetical protein
MRKKTLAYIKKIIINCTMSKYYQKTRSKITVKGPSKTTQGLERKPTNIKVPININGRSFRDPRAMDLVDIERAKDAAEDEVRIQAKEVTRHLKSKANEIRNKQIEEEVQKRINERTPDA